MDPGTLDLDCSHKARFVASEGAIVRGGELAINPWEGERTETVPNAARRSFPLRVMTHPQYAERTAERPAHHDVRLSDSHFMRRSAPAAGWVAYSQRRTEAL
jgi:hypothetical protein